MSGVRSTPHPVGPESEWPGRRIGLPESGPRSIVRPGRRIAALCIDWGLSILVSVAFFDYDPTATILVFAASQTVFLITASGSIGHLLLRMRVVPMSGGWIGPWRPVIRTLLLSTVIPALIWDRDQRGMHDRLAGTVLVRS